MAKKTARGVIPTEAPSDTPPHISVIAEGVDEWGRRYFRFGVGGKPIPNFPPVLVSRLIGNKKNEVLGDLANAGFGLFTPTAQRAFIKSVQEWGTKDPSFKVATRIGWHGGNYVLPDVIIGPNKNIYPSLAELNSDVLAKYRVRNSLPDWQTHVGKLCVNNSRLIFAVSLAFTGPILRFVSGVRSGGFQIYGDAETGKSTAAMVAGSVWGCHLQPDNGFIESWNTTASKVEITALAHNDGLLILDETKNAGSSNAKRVEVVKDVVMQLAEQKEKKRLPNTTAARSWRCFFLSTSNYAFTKMATMGGAVVDDADLGRLVDIPLPSGGHGIYEDRHGFPNGRRLTDELKKRCRIYYGICIREFIARLRQKDVKQARQFVQKARQRYRDDLAKRPRPTVPLQRASARFATVYAAGSLALSLGVLDWDRTALREAILKCQLDGLTIPNVQTEDPVISELTQKLHEYLHRNKAEFIDLRKQWLNRGAHVFGSALGYKANHQGYGYYYLTAKTLTSIIGSGADASRYKQSLGHEGRLSVSSSGRFVVERQIFTGKGKDGWESVHAIKIAPIKTSA